MYPLRMPRDDLYKHGILTPPFADVDGDSTMHSSPELDAEDELFPGEGPSTPRNAASFALDPTSELSPPNSQGRAPEDSLSALASGAPRDDQCERQTGSQIKTRYGDPLKPEVPMTLKR
ncbi:hypothetical protein N0V90_006824 [Kalmusia sp. IMI 367209]|nr:hypothetical protein N0V90_006824 [Kalmusia sp. IMI 367209]